MLSASVLSCLTPDAVQLCQNSHGDVPHFIMSGSVVTVPIEITGLGLPTCWLFLYKLVSW